MPVGGHPRIGEQLTVGLHAGADSIFYGDVLLTTGNPDVEADRQLLADAGVTANWQEGAAAPAGCSPR